MVANVSFESPALGSGFQYNPSVAGQYFASLAGIQGNGSAWAFADAPDGTQTAFIQGGGSDNGVVVLNVSGLTLGARYVVTFYAARRLSYTPETLHVTFQNVDLGYYAPASTSWGQIVTTSFIADTSVGAMSFVGITGGDSAAGIDRVTVTPSP